MMRDNKAKILLQGNNSTVKLEPRPPDRGVNRSDNKPPLDAISSKAKLSLS